MVQEPEVLTKEIVQDVAEQNEQQATIPQKYPVVFWGLLSTLSFLVFSYLGVKGFDWFGAAEEALAVGVVTSIGSTVGAFYGMSQVTPVWRANDRIRAAYVEAPVDGKVPPTL